MFGTVLVSRVSVCEERETYLLVDEFVFVKIARYILFHKFVVIMILGTIILLLQRNKYYSRGSDSKYISFPLHKVRNEGIYFNTATNCNTP